MKPNIFQKILGVDETILDSCSKPERSRLTLIGTLVLIPVVTASIAALLVARYMTDNFLVRLLIALIWGATIFIVDRGVTIAALRSEGTSVATITRWILGIFMGFLISTLMLTVLFEDRINRELQADNTKRKQDIEQLYQTKLEEAEAKRDRFQKELDEAEHALNVEVDGTGGSRVKNFGPAARRKAETRDRKQRELLKAEEEYQATFNELNALKAQEMSSIKEYHESAGLLTRIETLGTICAKSFWAMLVRIVFAVVFVLIELMGLIIASSNTSGGVNEYYELITGESKKQLKINEMRCEFETEIEQIRLQGDADKRIMRLEAMTTAAKFETQLERLRNTCDSLTKAAELYHEAIDRTSEIPDDDVRSGIVKKIQELYDRYLHSTGLTRTAMPSLSATL